VVNITKPDLNELLEPFARSICAKAKALKRWANDERFRPYRARLRKAISDDINQCTNYLPPEVSEAALVKAKKLGRDLFTANWHNQSSFDSKRKVFQWEHVVPVRSLVNLCLMNPTVPRILDVLLSKAKMAWILKREDQELTKRGYRSRREDPVAAYRECGIVLVKQRNGIRE